MQYNTKRYLKKRKKDDIIKLQKHIKIAPKFLVFYNGKSKMEDSHVEYLSAAFENLTGEPDLELKVLILNINEGHNRELMEQCKALKQYAKYVARVREYVEQIGLDAAVSRAVKEFHLEKEEVIKFLQNNLDIDEKAAKEMLEEE